MRKWRIAFSCPRCRRCRRRLFAGGEGNEGMSPKPIQKLLPGAESYVTITWKGFSTVFQVDEWVRSFLSADGLPDTLRFHSTRV